MAADYHRHYINDAALELIESHTVGNKGTLSGNAKTKTDSDSAVKAGFSAGVKIAANKA